MKRLIYKGILSVLIVLGFTSCATVSNITVNHVSNAGNLQSSAIYALPQTVIDVHVLAEEIRVVPGPYQKYADKYLGIENAPAKEEIKYQIKSISIGKHTEADPDFVYTVSGMEDPAMNSFYSALLKDSLIIPASRFSGNMVNYNHYPTQPGQVLYTDLSVKRNFEAEKDVEISMVMPDTNYVQRTSRTVLKEKTQEQKAEEAANFLIKLKKRRFKLVAGQYDYMPEGESMAAALKELARIEELYMSLFIGKRIVSDVSRNYSYVPENGKQADRPVLFRFSPSHGFVDAREPEGMPVILVIESMQKTRELEKNEQPFKPLSNAFPYRIADQANIKLMVGEQVWIESIFPVFQFGVNAFVGR